MKKTFRGLAEHLGLKVRYVDYLSDAIHGKLLPREKRILINARKPKDEHLFTLLHEIGHYVVHFKNPRKKYHPKFFDLKWKIGWLARVSSKIRRYYRYIFNMETGKEWEADVWAMCAFVYIARVFGWRGELFKFLTRHPEKRRIYLLAAYSVAYCDTKAKIKKVWHTLTMPFKAI
jgi:AraC-like DNA-binding protein